MKSFKEAAIPVTNALRIFRARRAFRSIRNQTPQLSKAQPKVLFHLVRTIPSSPISYLEAIMAHALQHRGAKAQLLVCGGYFDDCDADHYFNDQKSYCRRCSSSRAEFISAIGLETLFYKTYITDAEDAEIRELVAKIPYENYETYFYKGINVGYIAKTTLVRYYQNPFLKESDELRKRYKTTLIRAIKLVRIAENVFEREKPDIAITLHGIYTTWEPFYKYLLSRGVTTYTYAFCMGDIHGVRFVKDGRDIEKINSASWTDLKQRELSSQEKKEFESFLDDRFTFRRGYVTVLTNGLKIDDENTQAYSKFIERKCKKRFALFTNIPWDNALIQGDRIFSDIFQWFDRTIEFFTKHPEFDLIIKVHPGERIDSKSYTFSHYIREKYPVFPENIFFMNNSTGIKPYDLFDKIDAGIVYTGTLGLEMAICGIPAIVAGVANYTEAGEVVYPISSQDEYFNLLSNPVLVKEFATKNQAHAYKYGYVFFRKTEIPMPFFKENEYVVFDPNAFNHIEELVKNDKTIDSVCRQILKKSEIERDS